MNNISVIGRVGKDIELNYAKNGTAIAKFSVGVTRRLRKEETDWFNCVAFGKTAEIIAQYVKKGNQIGLVGEMQFGSYTDKEGNKRRTDNLVVNSFDFVGSNATSNNNNNINADSSNAGFDSDFTPADDEDMPF